MADMREPAFRHELKYLISERERDLVRQRLMKVAELDAHAKRGQYMIRSLYFDDFRHSAYEEKMDGTVERRKYRIRIYDLSRDVIHLECKRKRGNYIYKRSAELSPVELESILRGDVSFLLKREEPLLKEFYVSWMSDILRPEVLVDYERTPFVYGPGTVRITFDEHVRAARMGSDLFDGSLPSYETLDPGTLILEVKYTEFLPQIFRDILPLDAGEWTAASKYVFCADKFRSAVGVLAAPR